MNLSPRKRRCCYLDQEVVGHPRNEPRWNASMFPGWRDGVRGAGGVAGPTAELGSPGSGEERCSGPGWHGARLGRTRLSVPLAPARAHLENSSPPELAESCYMCMAHWVGHVKVHTSRRCLDIWRQALPGSQWVMNLRALFLSVF